MGLESAALAQGQVIRLPNPLPSPFIKQPPTGSTEMEIKPERRELFVNAPLKMILVGSSDIAALAAKLEEFRKGLTPEESGVFSQLLLRASGAPEDNPANINVSKRFFTVGLYQAGGVKTPESKTSGKGIIIQGGREQSQNEVTESPAAVLRDALGIGNVSIGPKQDDPRAVSGTGAASIGPKQDDPRSPTSTLAGKMQSFSNTLSLAEKGMMDWLLQRASSASSTASEAQGGLQPSPVDALRSALGIKSIGPKQDDPRTPPIDERWTLRF